MSGIESWLEAHGLGKYTQLLVDNEIDLDVLGQLTMDDLKELDLPLGARKRILSAIAAHPPRAWGAHDARPEASPEHGRQAERRQLSVMFCDLVGSTAIAVRLDPEELSDLLSEFRQACEAAIREHEGFVARHMGDGLLVYFGYPAAREDDAARAVRAGLAVVDAVRALAPRSEEILSVRVGVATGLVVAGETVGAGAAEELAVLGQTPNLAARLQALAEPDSVLIADDTRRLVAARFELEALPLRQVKGIEAPVAAFRVVRERDEPRAVASVVTDLVGRRAELAMLDDRWRAACDGETQVVLVCGEAGVGKSRLMKEFRDRIAGGAHSRILCFAAPHHRSTAFYPIVQQMERVLGFSAHDTAKRKLERLLSTLAAVGVDVDESGPWIADLLGLSAVAPWPGHDADAVRRKRCTVGAVQAIVEAMAARRPVLFVVEDLHWADPSTLDLLSALVARLTACRCLLLLSFRPEFKPTWSAEGHLSTLTLTRLSRREVPQLVTAVAGATALPERVVAEIVERTDGIPLFVEELTKSVLEGGELTGDTIPISLHDSLTARLDRLGPAKTVAQTASVVGRTFDCGLVAEVSGLERAEFDAALDRLLASGLVTPLGADEESYQFKHALVRDAAYESLLKRARRDLHRRIVQRLEEQLVLDTGVRSDLVETLAHHARAGALWEQAFRYARDSGARAVVRSGHREAIEHLEHALAALRHLDRSRERLVQEIDVCILLRGSYGVLGDVEAMLDVARRAEALASEIGDEQRRATTSILLGYILSHRGDIDEGIACGERARSIGERRGDERIAAGGRISASHGHLYRGHVREVVSLLAPVAAHLSSALRRERIGSPMTSSVNGFSNLAMALADSGDLSAAQTHAEIACEIARETARPLDAGYAELAAAIVRITCKDGSGAMSHARTSVDEWRRGEVRLFIGAAAATLARVNLLVDRIDVAASLADDALAELEAKELPFWLAFALETAALVALARHDMETADMHLGSALTLARRFGLEGREASALRVQGRVEVRRQRHDAADERLRAAAALARALDLRPLATHCGLDLGRLHAIGGRRTEAARSLDAALGAYREMGMERWALEAEEALLALPRAGRI